MTHQKPKKFDYNLIVIGAGSGGLVSAYSAAAVKMPFWRIAPPMRRQCRLAEAISEGLVLRDPDTGEAIMVPSKTSDRIHGPYANDIAARATAI